MKKTTTLGLVLATAAAAMFATGCKNMGSSYSDSNTSMSSHACAKGAADKGGSAKDRAHCKKAPNVCKKNACS